MAEEREDLDALLEMGSRGDVEAVSGAIHRLVQFPPLLHTVEDAIDDLLRFAATTPDEDSKELILKGLVQDIWRWLEDDGRLYRYTWEEGLKLWWPGWHDLAHRWYDFWREALALAIQIEHDESRQVDPRSLIGALGMWFLLTRLLSEEQSYESSRELGHALQELLRQIGRIETGYYRAEALHASSVLVEAHYRPMGGLEAILYNVEGAVQDLAEAAEDGAKVDAIYDYCGAPPPQGLGRELAEPGPRMAPSLPEEEPEPPPRYANAALVDETAHKKLNPQAPIAPRKVFRLRLDIGPLSPESDVEEPIPIPTHLLPKKDIWLDVMVSSTHFEVGRSSSDLGKSNVAHGRFLLPKDGSPATAPDGTRHLYFFMRAPSEVQTARARIGYYYENHLVQSQLLTANIGDGEGYYSIKVDYTLSQSLTGFLDDLLPSRRPQVSIVTNDNRNGTHQIIVRSRDGAGDRLLACTYELDEETIDDSIKGLRKVLRSEGVAPTTKQRRKDQLIRDLKKLVPWGWELWNTVVAIRQDVLYDVLDEHEDVVIHVSRPTTSSYAFPWGLMYDIPIESDREMKICPLVAEWDGKPPMVEVERGPRQCPAAQNGVHDPNTLCPFGFWGYRYPIEQLSSSEDKETARDIPVPDNARFEMVAAQTQYGVKRGDLEAHIKSLGQILKEQFPKAEVSEGKDRDEIRDLLGKDKDLPLVYFYCHGERSRGRKADTYLGVGKKEKITPEDFNAWRLDWKRRHRKEVWDEVRPLIFINACHSVEINPDTLVTYLDPFIGAANAAGVIGTEVKVNQKLAMELAAEFFKRFFKGRTVDQALHEIRLDYLAHGNLFGLVYTPYCWADLKLVRQR